MQSVSAPNTTKPEKPLWGKEKKLSPVHHLLHPCRELTAIPDGKVVQCVFCLPVPSFQPRGAWWPPLPRLPSPSPVSQRHGRTHPLCVSASFPFHPKCPSVWRELSPASSAHPTQKLGVVVADSLEASFSRRPLDPWKDDSQNLVCLIMSPWGIGCTPLKTETHQDLTPPPPGAARGLPGGAALPSPHSARAESLAQLVFAPSTGVLGPSPWKTVIPFRVSEFYNCSKIKPHNFSGNYLKEKKESLNFSGNKTSVTHEIQRSLWAAGWSGAPSRALARGRTGSEMTTAGSLGNVMCSPGMITQTPNAPPSNICQQTLTHQLYPTWSALSSGRLPRPTSLFLCSNSMTFIVLSLSPTPCNRHPITQSLLSNFMPPQITLGFAPSMAHLCFLFLCQPFNEKPALLSRSLLSTRYFGLFWNKLAPAQAQTQSLLLRALRLWASWVTPTHSPGSQSCSLGAAPRTLAARCRRRDIPAMRRLPTSVFLLFVCPTSHVQHPLIYLSVSLADLWFSEAKTLFYLPGSLQNFM